MTLDELRALATETRSGEPCWGDPYGMAPTLAECEFLYALARAVRPLGMIELGTGMGVSTKFITEALADNGRGELWSVENDEFFHEPARELLRDDRGAYTLTMIVDRDHPLSGATAEIVYIDSAPNHRYRDIEHWLTNGSSALVVVHDGNRDYLEFAHGVGTLVPSQAGLWIGRGR